MEGWWVRVLANPRHEQSRTATADDTLADGRRYACRVKPAGGLKLELKTAVRDDRRRRFAPVSVAASGGQNEIELVTDSRGRLRYHLAAGEYRLRLQHAPDVPIAVGDHGWTTVRLRLS